MNKDKITDYITYVLGVILAILILVFQKNYQTIFFIVCVFSILFGVLVLIKKQNMGFLLNGIGVGGLTALYCYKNSILDLGDSVTLFFCLSIAIMLLLSIIVGALFRKFVLKTFSLIVDAEVIDLVRNPNSKRDFYKAIYKYDIDGKEYVVEDVKFKSRFVPNIGDIKKLNVMPDDVANVYFIPSLGEDLFNLVGSLLFIIACVIIIFTLFR